jgi:hypothetical protein
VPPSVASRLARLRAATDELATLESRAGARLADLVKRFTCADVPPDPAAAAGLCARIDAAEARWQLDELDEIDRALTAATRAASQVVKRADETFSEWDLLRGRLETYRLRAARRGRAASQELAALHQHARQLLEAAPCDLRLAAQAAHQYMSMERGDGPEPEMS